LSPTTKLVLALALAVGATTASVVGFNIARKSPEFQASRAPARGGTAAFAPATSAPAAATFTPLPDRANCNEIRGAASRSETEQRWFESNCQTPAGPTSGTVAPPVGAAAANDANNFYQRGLLLITQRDFSGAVVEFNQALARDPNHIDALYNRGLSFYNLGQFERAIPDFTRVIELNSTQQRKAVAYTNRGVSHQGLNNHQAAIADFDRSIAIEPNNPVVYEHRGRSHVAVGNAVQACADFRKGLQLATEQGVQARIQSINGLIAEYRCP